MENVSVEGAGFLQRKRCQIPHPWKKKKKQKGLFGVLSPHTQQIFSSKGL